MCQGNSIKIVFQQTVLQQLDRWENAPKRNLTAYTKIYMKWITDLDVIAKTTEHLESTGEKMLVTQGLSKIS